MIIISPYAARLPNGRLSPKNFPHWAKLVSLLNDDGYEVVQVGVSGEDRIEGVAQFITNFPFSKLRTLVNECQTWIAVDNFWQHFIACERLRPGIVLWGQSDPRIFGYTTNINLLRGRDYLRQFQYQSWMDVPDRPDAFYFAENVMASVYTLAPPLLVRKVSLVSTSH